MTRKALLLAAAAAVYAAAAWQVAPGFYDGIGPPAPYCWVTPPPNISNTCKPASGQRVAKVTRGIVDPGTAFTDEGQAQMSWVPGAFQTADCRNPTELINERPSGSIAIPSCSEGPNVICSG